MQQDEQKKMDFYLRAQQIKQKRNIDSDLQVQVDQKKQIENNKENKILNKGNKF